MNTIRRARLAGLLLPLSVGVVGAIGYAINSSNNGRPASQAGNQSNGQGTVVPAASPTGNPGNGPGNNNGNGPNGVFGISGSVSGLQPGAAGVLTLTVTNPNNWPIQVLTIDTGVGTPNQTPCPATSLVVGHYTFQNGDPEVRIAAHGTTQVPVSVLLTDSPTDDQRGCPSATFPLTYTGTAQKVAGR